MGTMQHHAILATTSADDLALKFQDWLVATLSNSAFLWTDPTMNGYRTFIIPPDGSKEGWSESKTGDGIRELVINRLKADDYDDGSSSWDWVEVTYGELRQGVTRGNSPE